MGVTEAGDGEDGRVKSAVGIGALLEDGLGDTVRVSLTEDPEFESPVVKTLINRYNQRPEKSGIPPLDSYPLDPFTYSKRKTVEVGNFGGGNVPRVITDISKLNLQEPKELKGTGHFYLPEPDKWKMNDQGCDYLYSGTSPVPFMLPNGVKEIIDHTVWKSLPDKKNSCPAISLETLKSKEELHPGLNFLSLSCERVEEALPLLSDEMPVVVILSTDKSHQMQALRRAFVSLIQARIHLPVVPKVTYTDENTEKTMLFAATDVGGLLIDGLGDGIMIGLDRLKLDQRQVLLDQIKLHNSVSFGVLQAARTRMSKTEYISCPSCGRTLFDLQETTAMIRKRTDHLKGVKIGIMGCIVNGPGEMADADYGYVGSGKGKITLYKGKEVVKRSVPSERAVDELIEIIRQDGQWIEPETSDADH